MSTVKPEKAEKVMDSLEKVVVAVKAAKMIPRTALVWALTHVVRPGTCILLLVVVPSHSSGRKLWGFPRFAGDCANGHRKLGSGTTQEQKTEISDSCSQMMLQLQDVYGPTKINIKVKIISGSPSGAVAAESRLAQANWVVLDRHLKQEEKRCVEELQCNIVVIKRSQPKVLRLNLVASAEMEPKVLGPLPHLIDESSAKNSLNGDPQSSIQVPNATPTSSPEAGTPFSATEVGASSISSSDPATSPLVLAEAKDLGFKKEEATTENESQNSDTCSSDSESEGLMTPSTLEFQSWVVEKLSKKLCPKEAVEISQRHNNNAPNSIFRALLDKFSLLDIEAGINNFSHSAVSDLSSNVREKILASRNASPPLCSICQHKAPVFGKPPRLFSYAELELATGGFSQANFLAEGGFGSVHRGILPDGQVVAIKQHKLASSQGDVEFCSEVEVLSCAQHRNVVMLIGFCVEDKRRLLVYEYICNGSLDSHLYGCTREPLQWPARQKIAVGAARGLRYLHEECRVGCIVHRDLRPNNILVTHDFEAMVGDFGLARWQPDGDMGAETRVVGTFGYLAPEYAQSGQITEKTDVFSFGVVLVELVTGKKALDINRPKGQQCLTEWARPLLEENAVDELIDPRLKNDYSNNEVSCMLHAASLCIRRDGKARPRMSQILRILEGGMVL